MTIIKFYVSIECSHKIFDNFFIESDNNKKKIKIYDVYPDSHWISNGMDVYKTGSEWPKTSNLCCWYCTRKLRKNIGIGIPLGLPYKKELKSLIADGDIKISFYETLNSTGKFKLLNKNTKYIYHMIGCFCSFQCAKTWNNTSYNVSIGNKNERDMLLYEMYINMGFTDDILLAPPKEVLLKYGGHMTDSDYDECIINESVIDIQMPPSISSSPVISNKKIDKNNKYRLSRKNKLFSTVRHFFDQ